jgi:carbonic anhydrase/acetyltransferase-like protein (isoleucine patch superfamily)
MIRTFNGKTPRIADTAFVSEAAYIVGDVEIGEGSSVWPGAVIRGDFGRISIGRQTAVEDNCVIHSGTPHQPVGDVFIGDRVHMGHGAVMNGRRIGNNVLVGMNACILHDAEIGSFCIVGACCLIGQGMVVPDWSFVTGVPGQIRGRPVERQFYWLNDAYKEYTSLAEMYRKEGLG